MRMMYRRNIDTDWNYWPGDFFSTLKELRCTLGNDVHEGYSNDGNVVVRSVVVPGIKREALQVVLSSDNIVVKKSGDVISSFRVSRDIDRDCITAGLEDGILTIRMPLKTELAERTITIT